jgi:hypothetical protein
VLATLNLLALAFHTVCDIAYSLALCARKAPDPPTILQQRSSRPKGDPKRIKVQDFANEELGKVALYGMYDIMANAAWSASASVAYIRTWFERGGQVRHPNAQELTITADCGGSNGSRVRL